MGLDRVELHARAEADGHRAGDHVRVEVQLHGQQALSALVALAHHAGRVRAAVERLLERRLHERALLLDHQDLVEAAGELARDLTLQRPDHAQLEDADAGAVELAFAQPEVAQRVEQVEIGLAARHDAQPGVARALDAVDPVLAGVGEGQIGAHAQHGALHVERLGRQQVARRLVHVPEVGQHGSDAPRGDLGGAHRVGHAGHDLEAGPETRGARAGIGVQAEIEHLLNAPGKEDRHVKRGQQGLGRARDRRGLAARVVAHHGQAAAGARDADEVPVTQGIAGAVEPRRLAVPQAQHSVVAGAGEPGGELAAPGRGGAELLVERRYVAHVVFVEEVRVARQLLVEAAQRRALITGDHRAGGQAAGPIGPVLVEHEAYEALDPGQQDPAFPEQVLVVEGDLAAPGRPHGSGVGR